MAYRSMSSNRSQGVGIGSIYSAYDTTSLTPQDSTATLAQEMAKLNLELPATTAEAAPEEDNKSKLLIAGVGAAVVIAGAVIYLKTRK